MAEINVNQILARAKYTDYKLHDFECDVDPENQLSSSLNSMCDYNTEEQFNGKVSLENKFSVIHFNCRSLYKNFTKICEFLKTTDKGFSVIAVSETWYDGSRGIDFRLDGYELFHSSRNNKKGGGAALFINNNLKCKRVNQMTTAVDDIFECLTVEIDMYKKRNVIVMCV